MRKTHVYGLWHHYKLISLVAIIVGLVASSAMAAYALRSNNLKMLDLKQAVYAADQSSGDTEKALQDLRQFVNGHMNTNLRAGSNSSEPPIQLIYRFNAAVAAEQARIVALGGANKVYVEAQKQCEISSVPLMARAQCIQDYVTANGTGIPQLNLPPKDFYTFDFASPTWSPDAAGWSLAIASLFAVALLIRLIIGRVIGRYLKN